jgi:hypothetical protein
MAESDPHRESRTVLATGPRWSDSMSLVAALTVALSLGAGPADSGRLLLCRPSVQGEAGLARADALPAAARELGSRFLDYGVACEGEAEAVRAARRAGLTLAISSVAEGRSDGSRYTLVLSSVDQERPLARRELRLAPGADPVPPLRRSLGELAEAVPRPGRRLGPWVTGGAGAALLAAGGVLALVARGEASARDRAQGRADWRGYVSHDASWRRLRTASGVGLGAGAAALAVAFTWQLAF